jgi:hypothetical protein
METEKRVNEIRWSEAVSVINRVVNQQLTAIEKDDTLDSKAKKSKVNEIEKAWQRILVG